MEKKLDDDNNNLIEKIKLWLEMLPWQLTEKALKW